MLTGELKSKIDRVWDAFYFDAVLPHGQQPQIMEPDRCSEITWHSLEEFKTLVDASDYDINGMIVEKWGELLNK